MERGLIVSLTSSIYVGSDVGYSMPVHIHRVAQRFPDLTIVVPHAAFPWAAVMCGVAFQRPNIYLMPDIYLNVPGLPGSDDYFRAANGFLSYRFLYGSSYPVRPLGQSIRSFKSLPFDSDEIRARCLGGNAARLLGLPSKRSALVRVSVPDHRHSMTTAGSSGRQNSGPAVYRRPEA